jgi:subtilisin
VRRTLLLLTMMGAMLLAFSGVVLAQQDRTTSNSSEQGSAGKAEEVIPGKYIVVLQDDADPDATARQHRERYGARVTHVYRHAIKGYAAELPEQAVSGVSRDPRVKLVDADRTVEAFGQTAPTGVQRIGGSTNQTNQTLANKGTGVGVAVIDTGIDLDHPDLGQVAGGKNCSTGRSYDDGNGHGTHVAGTIAARDNTVGVVGVAPQATLYAVRVLNNSGSGSWSSIICGVDWVTANASTIKVANMSLGGSGSAGGKCTDSSLRNAICNSVGKGVTYAVAAGNSTADATNFVPAAYPEVITVSALADFNGEPGGGANATCRSDEDDTFADFSNYGAPVDIGAPGVCINSTWKDGGYNTISGTSMATPHVAGAAALYKEANPSATPEQVKSGLISGQEPGPILEDPDSFKEGIVHVS